MIEGKEEGNMEFEKDYVLRMAKELGDAIARLVFGRSLESVEETSAPPGSCSSTVVSDR